DEHHVRRAGAGPLRLRPPRGRFPVVAADHSTELFGHSRVLRHAWACVNARRIRPHVHAVDGLPNSRRTAAPTAKAANGCATCLLAASPTRRYGTVPRDLRYVETVHPKDDPLRSSMRGRRVVVAVLLASLAGCAARRPVMMTTPVLYRVPQLDFLPHVPPEFRTTQLPVYY